MGDSDRGNVGSDGTGGPRWLAVVLLILVAALIIGGRGLLRADLAPDQTRLAGPYAAIEGLA